jgi:AmiR/NasT family two-component response regulator
MTTVLIFQPDFDPTAQSLQLQRTLEAMPFNVAEIVVQCDMLVQAAVRHQPDAVLCELAPPFEAALAAVARLGHDAPCPVVAFIDAADAGLLDRMLEVGVHALVPDGLAGRDMGALVQVAQARFRHEQVLRTALVEAKAQLEERKVVERAKTILMRARSLSDDDAFRALRTASMHANLRLAQVSRQVIDAARMAECVNRAGQLRMLSQRLLKLHLLALNTMPKKGGANIADALIESAARIDDNLAWLHNHLPGPGLAAALNLTGEIWRQLRHVLTRPQAVDLKTADVLAERLLDQAEQLTCAIETAGGIAPLRVLNLAGRQRMLSQRFACQALWGATAPGAAPSAVQALAQTRREFDQALHFLNNIPLSTPDIRSKLKEAHTLWLRLNAGAIKWNGPEGRREIAKSSEALLSSLDELSGAYESSMQMLMG